MSYNLFLDDIRVPIDVFSYTQNLIYYNNKWVIVRSYAEFVLYITNNGIPDVISFDHDLADEHYRESMYDGDGHYSNYYHDGTFKEKTGYDCAKWLCEHCLDQNLKLPKEIYIHSMNPVGSVNIKSIFDTFNKIHKI